MPEDFGLGTAARSAILKVTRAVPEPFRPAAAGNARRADLAEQAADVVTLYSNMRLGLG